MTRVAFTLAGGSSYWTGGFNYLRNLFQVLRRCKSGEITPVLFVGPEVPERDIEILAEALGEDPKRAPWLAASHRNPRLIRALMSGRDGMAERMFAEHCIDVVFEAGEYYGPRFRFPVVTWIADFQSHYFPQLFSFSARWRTYLGRHLQFLGKRAILLSSLDAERDCLRFYPASSGRTVVVPFAVLPKDRPLPTNAVTHRHGLPEKFLYLPNQFWKHKNHLVIIEALATLRVEVPEIVVAASGSPTDHRNPGYFDSLVEQVNASKLQSMFRFLGMVPIDDVAGLMELSVATVNPSLCEGWSTTVEEAKALGVPLVLSSLAVHREQAGQNAIYFETRSPIDAARAMRLAWNRPVSSPESRRDLARQDLHVRVSGFADRFELAIDQAVRLYRSGQES